jgi:hypothetical protein
VSNREIGAQLFISGLTGEWHLRMMFAKLGISFACSFRQRCPRKPAHRERPA